MSPTVKRVLIAAIAAILAAFFVLPAANATPLTPSDGVECDPSSPAPGEQTTCTATGMEPLSSYTWQAQFADGATDSGGGTTDDEGTAEFATTAPEGDEARGDYTVTVTGTGEDGEPYEESHEGTVGGGGLIALPDPSSGEPTEDPSEDPSEEPSEEPGTGGSDGPGSGETAPGGGDSQVSPVPSGAVAAGAGGLATAADSDAGRVQGLAAFLLVSAISAHVLVRRRVRGGEGVLR